MRSIFCEPYDEEYARLCIEKTFSDLKWELVRRKNDPPDLEDNKKHIGVEVVRAVEQKTAQIQGEYARYCAEGREQKRRKFLEKIASNDKCKFVYDLNRKIDGVLFINGEEQYTLIKKMIIKKTKRLNKQDYPRYNEDCLFVYNSGGFCFKNKVIEFMKDVEEEIKSYCRRFRKIIIYCDNEIFLYDAKDKSIECANISDIEIKKIQEEVLFKLGRIKEYNCNHEFFNI